MDIYRKNGFNDRDEYLRYLAGTHDVELDIVLQLSELLGPGEDFDGLVSTLDDMAW